MTSENNLEFTPKRLDRSAPFYVAGHRGLVGSAIWNRLQTTGFTNLHALPSTDLNLLDREATFAYFKSVRPRYVVLAAAKVGGILANANEPVNFLSENLRIQTNVMDASLEVGVERLLFLGSSCIYPKFSQQPIPESELLTGPLEPTNDAYAIAKIAGIIQVHSVRRQFGLPWISAMPTNLYGEGDNFTTGKSHVLPALIKRYVEAKLTHASAVTNWGSGTPRREFLHSSDVADACLYLLENYDGDSHVNVGTGSDVTIKELATKIADIVGFEGQTYWDDSKPDGTPQKLLDVALLRDIGWESSVSLDEGLKRTINWYLREQKN